MTSFLFFYYLTKILRRQPKPSNLEKRKYAEFTNLQVSLVHSAISGAGACYALSEGSIWTDLIYYYSPSASIVIKISTGYFLFDIYGILETNDFNLSRCWELWFHHFAVLTCIGTSGFFDYYHGFSSIALLMEVHTVFLHLRSLMKLMKQCNSCQYRINAFINIVTLVIFRILVACSMLYLFQTHFHKQQLWEFYICNFGVLVVGVMNCFILYRCLSFDLTFMKTKSP